MRAAMVNLSNADSRLTDTGWEMIEHDIGFGGNGLIAAQQLGDATSGPYRSAELPERPDASGW
jgi:hypothetical protein